MDSVPVMGFMKKSERKIGRREGRLEKKGELSCRFSQIPLLGAFPDLVFPNRLNPTHTHTEYTYLNYVTHHT